MNGSVRLEARKIVSNAMWHNILTNPIIWFYLKTFGEGMLIDNTIMHTL